MALRQIYKSIICCAKYEWLLSGLKINHFSSMAADGSQIFVIDNNVTCNDVMKYIVQRGIKLRYFNYRPHAYRKHNSELNDTLSVTALEAEIPQEAFLLYLAYGSFPYGKILLKFQEDTFLVLDIDDIIKKYKQWESLMNHIKTYYAVKANDNSIVLKVLASLHSGFDCASKEELNKVMKLIKHTKHSYLDSPPIIFANPTKIPHHILYAKSIGVDYMTFDNEEELYKLKKLYPTVKLLLRIRSDAKRARFSLGKKFGCDAINEAPVLIESAKSLGLNIMGVAFHVGSSCEEPESFERGISKARFVFDYAKKSGIDFSILDIGGGYPGSKYSSIKEYAGIINPAFQKNFSDIKVSVISEPGTYYVSSAFTLAVKIHSRKVIYNSDKTISNIMYYVDNGIFGTLSPITYGEPCPKPVPLGDFDENHFSSTIWGPTCDSLDCIIKNIELPCLNIGDWITFEDMGAYTTVLTTNFNGFPPPRIFPIIRESNWEWIRNSPLFSEETFVFKDITT